MLKKRGLEYVLKFKIKNKIMKEKHYQFMILDEYEWDVEDRKKGFRSFDVRNFDKALADFGQEGWYIVAVNYVKKNEKLYSIVTMERESK